MSQAQATKIESAVAVATNATQLFDDLLFLSKIKHPTMIHGQPGCGKSSIVRQVAEHFNKTLPNGCQLFDVRLGQLSDVSDLRGIPYFDSDGKVMKWAPPVDLPSAEYCAQFSMVILFLDELTTAPAQIAAGAYQLVLDRRIGTYALPENVVVIAAGNRVGDRGVASKMVSPLANRFTHFDLEVNFESWMEWAVVNDIHPDILGFLNYKRHALNQFDPKAAELPFASPRTWEFSSNILRGGCTREQERRLIAGTVGEGLAAEFHAHRSLTAGLPIPSEIIAGKYAGKENEVEIENISAQFSLALSLVQEFSVEYNKARANVPASITVESEINDAAWSQSLLDKADNMFAFMMATMNTEIQMVGLRTMFMTYKVRNPGYSIRTKMKTYSAIESAISQIIVPAMKISGSNTAK